MRSILKDVAAKHGVTPETILSRNKKQWIANIRHEFYYRAVSDTVKSFSEIGRFCGGRDHTTVLYGVSHHCAKNNLPHPRNALDNMFIRKQRQHQKNYKRVLSEIHAQAQLAVGS
jgi:hypothetical protein